MSDTAATLDQRATGVSTPARPSNVNMQSTRANNVSDSQIAQSSSAREVQDSSDVQPVAADTQSNLRLEIRLLSKAADRRLEFFERVYKLLFSQPHVVASTMRLRLDGETIAEFDFDEQAVAAGKDAYFRTEQAKAIQAISSNELSQLRLLSTQKNGVVIGVIAIPIPFPTKSNDAGWMAFSVRATGHQDLEQRLAEFSDAITFASAVGNSVAKGGSPTTVSKNLEIVGKMAIYETCEHMCFALVNNLSQRFACEQVAIGLVRHNRVKLVAISGTDTFKENSPGIVDLLEVMEECRDVGELVSSQSAQQTRGSQQRPIHRRWASTTQSNVCSVPLKVDGLDVAVVSFRRPASREFTTDELGELAGTVEPFSTALELYERSRRNFKECLLDATRGAWKNAFNPKTRTGAVTRIVAASIMLFLIFGQLPYRPKCKATLVPSHQTHILAPFDCQLAEVFVEPGQSLKANDVMFRLDTSALTAERAQMVAEWERNEAEVRHYLSQGDAANASLSKAASAVASAKLAAAERKLELCTVRAPYDGVVSNSDLKRNIGQAFPIGQPLLTFTPMDQFEVELRLSESIASMVEAGCTGDFTSVANPSDSFECEVYAIDGSARVIDGQNVITAHARLHSTVSMNGMRSGMEGVAHANVGWKPVPWIMFHKVIDYVRLNMWL
jgi:hypothetical protein